MKNKMTTKKKRIRKAVIRPVPVSGTKYSRVYKGKKYTMTVIEKQGEVKYVVKGVECATPSAAAKCITNTSVNGYVFWKMDG